MVASHSHYFWVLCVKTFFGETHSTVKGVFNVMWHQEWRPHYLQTCLSRGLKQRNIYWIFLLKNWVNYKKCMMLKKGTIEVIFRSGTKGWWDEASALVNDFLLPLIRLDRPVVGQLFLLQWAKTQTMRSHCWRVSEACDRTPPALVLIPALSFH